MSIDDGRQPALEQDPASQPGGEAAAGAGPEAAVESPAAAAPETPPSLPREPRVGDVVIYHVSEHDEPNTRHNAPKILPAVVTAVWGPVCANLKILTDGPVNTWKTSALRGDGPGNWDFRD